MTLQATHGLENISTQHAQYHKVEDGQIIVACQRGGVSSKPTLGSGQQQDTGPGILWSVHRWTNDLIHVKHLT